jgi:hypothetical protein
MDISSAFWRALGSAVTLHSIEDRRIGKRSPVFRFSPGMDVTSNRELGPTWGDCTGESSPRSTSIGKTSWVFRNADNLHYVKRLEGHGNLSRSGKTATAKFQRFFSWPTTAKRQTRFQKVRGGSTNRLRPTISDGFENFLSPFAQLPFSHRGYAAHDAAHQGRVFCDVEGSNR